MRRRDQPFEVDFALLVRVNYHDQKDGRARVSWPADSTHALSQNRICQRSVTAAYTSTSWPIHRSQMRVGWYSGVWRALRVQ
jgi:hypothetical protein